MDRTRLQQLLQFLKNNPEDAFIQFALAKEYEQLGEMEKALLYYLDLTKGHPDYIGTYYHLGKLYERRGEVKKAIEAYSQGIKIARKIGDSHALGELAAAKMILSEEEEE